MKKCILQEISPGEKMALHGKKMSCAKRKGWAWNSITNQCEEVVVEPVDKPELAADPEPAVGTEPETELAPEPAKPKPKPKPKKIISTLGLKDLSTDELINLRSDRTRLKELYAGVFGPGGDGEKALNEYGAWSEAEKKEVKHPLDNFFLLRYFLGTKSFPPGPGRSGKVETRYRRRQRMSGNLIYDLGSTMRWRAPAKMLLDKTLYDDHGFPWPTEISEGQTKESYRKLQYEKLIWHELMVDPDRPVSIPEPVPEPVEAELEDKPEAELEAELEDKPEAELEAELEDEPPLMEITKENDFRMSLSLEGCGGPCVPHLKIRWQDADRDRTPDDPGGGVLYYGKNDPLDIRSDTRYDLNPLMQKFFGINFAEYWSDNKEDIIKPVIVRRNNGTIERPQTLENNFDEGDVAVSVPNFWPIHVAFAYEEYVNNTIDEENLGFEYILFHPDEASLKKYRNTATKWGIKIEYDTKVLIDKAKEVLSRRIAYYGTGESRRAPHGEAMGGFGQTVYKAFTGYFQKGMINPHGGIGGEAVKNISDISNNFLAKANIGKNLDRRVKEPTGAPLFVNYNSAGGIESISLKPTHGYAIESEESRGCTECVIPLLAKKNRLIVQSVYWAPQLKYIDDTTKEVLNLGHPVLLPKNWRDGEVFTKAERIFAKRLGIKLDLDYKWSFKTGETNLIGVPNYAHEDLEENPYYFSDIGGIVEETPPVQMIKIIKKPKETTFKKEATNSGLWTGRQGLKPGQEYLEADEGWLRIREYFSRKASKPRQYHTDASPEVIEKLGTMTISDAAREWNTTWECRTGREICTRVFTLPDGSDHTIGRGHSIKDKFEANLFRPYDVKGKLSNSYGLKRYGRLTVKQGTKRLTEEQIEELKDYDVNMIVAWFIKDLTVVPTQNQFDALFSKVYNSGKRSQYRGAVRALNAGKVKLAAGRLKHKSGIKRGGRFIEIPGLTTRRLDEHRIFSTPDGDGFPTGSRTVGVHKKGDKLPHWAGELYGTRLDNMDRIEGKAAPVVEPEGEETAKPGIKVPLKEAKVLIFGHSQSGPYALGGRQLKTLKSRNIKSRIHIYGTDDKKLAKFIVDKTKKHHEYTHAILHLNGNDWRAVPDREERGDNDNYPLPHNELYKKLIIEHVIRTLGIPEERIWLLVPPHNKDYKGPRRKQYNNREESHKRAIEWFKLEYPSAHVPDLIYAGKKSFFTKESKKGEGLHMRSHSPESKQLSNNIADEMEATIEKSEEIKEVFTINNIFDIISETIEKNNGLVINKL